MTETKKGKGQLLNKGAYPDRDGVYSKTFGYSKKEMKEALKESEKRYHNLFEQSNDAIFVHDLDGNIIDVNQKVLDLFGYTKSQILSLKVSKLHPDYVLSKSQLAFETISRTGSVNFEIDFKKKACWAY